MRQVSQIHVTVAADARYERPLAVTLASLADVHAPGECRVSVIHRGLSPTYRRSMDQAMGDRLPLTWLPVESALLRGTSHAAFVSMASNYRLLLPAMLPEEQERSLYIDADTVVMSTLRPLWETDLGDNLVGAVRDAAAPWAAGPAGPDWRRIGLQPDAPYFNAGVLVVPLSVWRAEGTAERALEVLRRHSTRWGDQDALNVVVQHQWLQVQRRWNLQTADCVGRGLAWALWPEEVQAAVEDPAVLHLTESDKPWLLGSHHPFAGTWFHYLDQTPFVGWRPSDVHRHRYRRVGNRVRRAGRVLLQGA